MYSAFGWGFFSGCALLLGAWIAWALPIGRRTLGAIMAFGAGVLVSAVSFELVEKAVATTDGDWVIAIGMFLGAFTFYWGDTLIDRAGGKKRGSVQPQGGTSSGTAILLGTVLDGVPESLVIGLGLVSGGGVSAAMVAAVFLSNLPEAITATTGLRASGWRAGRLFGMWLAVAVVAGLASLAGFALLRTAPDELVAGVQAFAAGALLTMIADSMMPEAFAMDGRTAGVFTTLGFGVAYAIGALAQG
jgi:ZIP family zinc transporter